MTKHKRTLALLWPLTLVFLPVWLANFVSAGGASTVWNPLAIAALWPASLAALFEYSASFCIGAVVTLALCLFWYVRMPSLFYGALLFFAACTASPSWAAIVRLWHYLVQGQAG